jgi:transcriptional regulator with XRE-family HTH domain
LTLAGVMHHVGRKIRQFRVLKGLSQQDLADMIHKGRPLISHIENTGKVHHATLVKICKALQITPEQIQSTSNEPDFPYGAATHDEHLLMKAELEKLRNELLLKDEIIGLLKAQIRQLHARSSRGKK